MSINVTACGLPIDTQVKSKSLPQEESVKSTTGSLSATTGISFGARIGSPISTVRVSALPSASV